jgi:hypothetical protein
MSTAKVIIATVLVLVVVGGKRNDVPEPENPPA